MSKIPPRTLNWATSSTIFHALETDCREMGGKLLGPSGVSLSQLESRRGEGRAEAGVRSRESPTGGDDDPKIAATIRSRVSTLSPATSACASASPKLSRGG